MRCKSSITGSQLLLNNCKLAENYTNDKRAFMKEITMSELEQQFEMLLEKIKNEDMDYRPTQQEKLKLYGLFKQISEGDVHGEKPSMTKFVERAKYTAWERCKGMSKEEAMEAYISVFEGKVSI